MRNRFSIQRELARLSMPILIGMIFELVCTLLDIFWVARIHPADTAVVSGVGLVFPVLFLLTAMIQGISAGISTIIAIAAGRKDGGTIKKVGKTGFGLSFYSGLIITALLCILGGGIINQMAGKGVSALARGYALDYLVFYAPGILFLFCAQALLAVLQGEGSTKHIGWAVSISTFINAVLDPVFIFVLGFGVKGAAMTTSLAQILLFLYAFRVMKKNKKDFLSLRSLISLDFPTVRQILKLGIPQSISFVILSASFAVVNWFIGSMDETFLDAYTLVTRFDGALLAPTLAFSIGLSIMVGQNYGAGKRKELKGIVIRGTAINMLISILAGLVYMAVARPLFGIMTGNEAVVSLALKQVYLLTIAATVGNVLGLCAGNAFQAVEKPILSTFIMLLRYLLITVPCIMILQSIFGKTREGVWISLAAGGLAGGIIGFVFIMNHDKMRGEVLE